MKFSAFLLILGFLGCTTKPKVECSSENNKQMFFILAKGITPDLKIATELAEIMKKREHKKISEDEYGDKIKVLKDELTISRNKLKAELNTFLSDRPECKSQEAEKFLNK